MGRLCVIGPVVLAAGGSVVELTSPRDARLVRRLALAGGHGVNDESLVEAVWGDARPRDPRHALAVVVNRVRALLATCESPPSLARGAGWTALVGATSDLAELSAHVDAWREARRRGRRRELRHAATAALQLWHDPLLGGDTWGPWAREVARIDELFLTSAAALLDACLAAPVELPAAIDLVRDVRPAPTGDERLEALLLAGATLVGDAARGLRRADAVLDGIRSRGLDPRPQLVDLAETVRSGQVDRSVLLALVATDGGLGASESAELPPGHAVVVAPRRELAVLVRPPPAHGEEPIVVTGPPGVGMTRLLTDAAQELRLAGWVVIRVAGSDAVRQLDRLLDEGRAEIAGGAFDALALDGDHPQRLVVAARLLSRSRPVGLLVEDAHELDDRALSELEVLIGQRISRLRVVLSVAAGEAAAFGARLRASGIAPHPVELAPLEHAAAMALCHQRRPDLPPELHELVGAISSGRPAVLVELLSALPPAATPAPGPGLDPGAAVAVLGQVALDALSPAARDVLVLVALAGGHLDGEELRAAARSELDPVNVDRALDELVGWGLVSTGPVIGLVDARVAEVVRAAVAPHRAGSAHRHLARAARRTSHTSPAAARRFFAHARELAGLGGVPRSLLEPLVDAAELRVRSGDRAGLADDLDLGLVAIDERMGEATDDLAPLLCRALLARAEVAERDGDDEVADAALRRVLSVARRRGLPDQFAAAAVRVGGGPWSGRARVNAGAEAALLEAHRALAPGDRGARARVSLALAYRQIARGEQRSAAALVTGARRDAVRSGDPRLLTEISLGELDLRPPHREVRRHLEVARRGIETARLLGADDLVQRARFHEAAALLAMLDDPGARTLRRLVNTSADDDLASAPARPLLSFFDGELEQAESQVLELLAVTSAGGDLRGALGAQYADLLALGGRVGGLAEHLEVRPGAPPLVLLGVCRLLVAAGRAAEVVGAVPRLVAACEEVRVAAPVAEVVYLAGLAVVATAVGDHEAMAEVQDLLRPSSGLAASAWVHVFDGAVDHHLATLALSLGEVDEAVRLAEAALAQHLRLGALPWIARTGGVLASARAAAGDTAGASDAAARSGRLLQHLAGGAPPGEGA